MIELPEGHTTRPPQPKSGPRKSANAQNDMRHWSELCGAKISPDARQLTKADTSLALRGALVSKDEGRFAAYHHPTYAARWAEARDVSKPDVVRELLEAAGLDGEAALARAESQEMVDRLRSLGYLR